MFLPPDHWPLLRFPQVPVVFPNYPPLRLSSPPRFLPYKELFCPALPRVASALCSPLRWPFARTCSVFFQASPPPPTHGYHFLRFTGLDANANFFGPR